MGAKVIPDPRRRLAPCGGSTGLPMWTVGVVATCGHPSTNAPIVALTSCVVIIVEDKCHGLGVGSKLVPY